MWQKIWYSFPVQLLLLHAKKNQWLLLVWLVLFGFVLQRIGIIFGVPYLFLDPEYNNRISFEGLFIVGVSLGGFTMAFHITCYALDAHRFGFLGNETNPFTKFCVNNSTVPLAFLLTYLICFIRFQSANFAGASAILWEATGLLLGYVATMTLLFYYFVSTNKDIFKVLAGSVNNQLRGKRRISRTNVLKKVNQVRNNRIRVDYFLTGRLRIRPADSDLIDLSAALKVLRQNHQNSFIIQCFVFAVVLLLSMFRDRPDFQIPAAASIILLLMLGVQFAGAFSYWLGRWSVTAFVALLLVVSLLMKYRVVQSDYAAFGMSYDTQAEYSIERIRELSSPENYQTDVDSTIAILERWKSQFPQGTKPKMILLSASGGGQRAALWTMRSLQVADSALGGKLMKHTVLMTGASGGLLGAGYFRELYLRKQTGEPVDVYSGQYLHNISKDNLNAVSFSLVVSDMLFKLQQFNYGGHRYYKDRGYAFEQQLNRNTEGVLDKPLIAYREPERQARIPMLILAPTVINDGRKLYISAQHVSYMTDSPTKRLAEQRLKGIEFRRFFEHQQAENLRFLTALRLNATFPYIMPNVALPSQPTMEIMDAGLSDNFGIADAVRFLYVFREWISRNTSGVVFVSIRDTPKEHVIEKNANQSLLDKVFTPIGSLYQNWHNMQDVNNDNSLEFTQSWFKGPVERIEIKYAIYAADKTDPAQPATRQDSVNRQKLERVSLSWRLTEREKASLTRTIYDAGNQQAIARLGVLLNTDENPVRVVRK